VGVLLLVVLCGFGVGCLAGLLGVGGSFLLVPILHVVLGIPIETAVGSTACQLLGPSTAAVLARKLTLKQLRLPLILAGGILMGVILGTSLLQEAGEFDDILINGRTVPANELLVLGVYLMLLTSIGGFALFEVWQHNRGRRIPRGSLARLQIGPIDSFSELENGTVSIPVLSMFGFVTGLTAGLLGISGGLILIPGLIYLLGMKSRQAILVSLIVVWITSLQGTIFHALHDNVNLKLVCALMFGGTIGARLSSEFGANLKGLSIRKSIGWLSLLAAGIVLFQLVRLLTGSP
jgi:uncharacterized membrane protein YfcA